jgi:hypothetical protein
MAASQATPPTVAEQALQDVDDEEDSEVYNSESESEDEEVGEKKRRRVKIPKPRRGDFTHRRKLTAANPAPTGPCTPPHSEIEAARVDEELHIVYNKLLVKDKSICKSQRQLAKRFLRRRRAVRICVLQNLVVLHQVCCLFQI